MSVKAAPVGGEGAAEAGAGGGVARHVAIIMDGNGRWAKAHFLPRAMGHRRGVEAVRALVRGCRGLGLDALTLYAFSSENWRRPADEVSDLMGLLKRFIVNDIDEMVENDIRLRVIGDWRALDAEIVTLIEGALARTSQNTGTILAIALNYGSQDEIARAATRAAAKLGPAHPITPETIEAELDTARMPPLDLMIRTSGEVRLSNFLLWQAAYAEMVFTPVLWPDFTVQHLKAAMDDFARRERRFGGR